MSATKRPRTGITPALGRALQELSEIRDKQLGFDVLHRQKEEALFSNNLTKLSMVNMEYDQAQLDLVRRYAAAEGTLKNLKEPELAMYTYLKGQGLLETPFIYPSSVDALCAAFPESAESLPVPTMALGPYVESDDDESDDDDDDEDDGHYHHLEIQEFVDSNRRLCDDLEKLGNETYLPYAVTSRFRRRRRMGIDTRDFLVLIRESCNNRESTSNRNSRDKTCAHQLG